MNKVICNSLPVKLVVYLVCFILVSHYLILPFILYCSFASCSILNSCAVPIFHSHDVLPFHISVHFTLVDYPHPFLLCSSLVFYLHQPTLYPRGLPRSPRFVLPVSRNDSVHTHVRSALSDTVVVLTRCCYHIT